MNMSRILVVIFVAQLSLAASLQAVDLPAELPLWEKPPTDYAVRHDVKEQLRSHKSQPGSPSGIFHIL